MSSSTHSNFDSDTNSSDSISSHPFTDECIVSVNEKWQTPYGAISWENSAEDIAKSSSPRSSGESSSRRSSKTSFEKLLDLAPQQAKRLWGFNWNTIKICVVLALFACALAMLSSQREPDGGVLHLTALSQADPLISFLPPFLNFSGIVECFFVFLNCIVRSNIHNFDLDKPIDEIEVKVIAQRLPEEFYQPAQISFSLERRELNSSQFQVLQKWTIQPLPTAELNMNHLFDVLREEQEKLAEMRIVATTNSTVSFKKIAHFAMAEENNANVLVGPSGLGLVITD